MMAFAGPSHHRCKCFGEEDGRDGSWRACPPDLCEADVLVEDAAAREQRLGELESALREIMNAEPDDPGSSGVTAWPSFSGRLQTIAGDALRGGS